jgi:hypothetical protein
VWACLIAVVVVATIVAVRSPRWLADRADVALGVVGAVFVLFQVGMVVSMNDVLRHASVMPYFRRRVGDITTYASGESLARHVDELDEVARTYNVAPLSTFGWNDDLEDEPTYEERGISTRAPGEHAGWIGSFAALSSGGVSGSVMTGPNGAFDRS